MKLIHKLSVNIGMKQASGEETKWDEIKLRILEVVLEPYYFLRRHYYNFIRACSFFKIGYYNYDFDYTYLLEIMKFKLERMEKCIRRGCHEEADKVADEVKYAVKILKRLVDNNYSKIYGRLHNKRWGELITWWEPCSNNQKMSIHHSKFSKAKTKRQQKKASKEFMTYMKEADERWEEDMEDIFQYISKNLQKWWD